MPQPNILMIVTDQHRGDALGIAGHPVLQTPFLDALAAGGVRFSRAYTACPICVAARRTLLTGQRPRTHGVFSNYHTLLHGPTLPGELGQAGYQTHLVGKSHLHPQRKLYGFHSSDWADGPRGLGTDYHRFLVRSGLTANRIASAHGMDQNGWAVRPWHLEERFHFSNWCVDSALDFLDRRDPTRPFFLAVNLIDPHQALTPPGFYFDRYMNLEIPPPAVGAWARVFDRPVRGLPPASWRICLEAPVMKQYQAAYYACVNHLDSQIGRLLQNLPRDTVILFTADHGEMLGDHQWMRKRNAYEGSARVPLLLGGLTPSAQPPAPRPGPGLRENGACSPDDKARPCLPGIVIDRPVELMDIMPTLLEAAGAPIPDSVEGQSLLPLVRGEQTWRAYVHGECSDVPTRNSGMQYLTDGKRKYVYLPGPGVEEYFDLEKDPRELVNLAAPAGGAGDPAYAAEIAHWRSLLMKELAGRPEGFTDGRRLLPLGGPSAPCLPSVVRPD